MNKIINIVTKPFLAVVLLVVLSSNSIHAAEQEMMDRVLVIVNEDVITQSEFNYRYESLLADLTRENRQLPPNIKKQVLDSMVSDLMQVQEAERRGITISDAELNQAIERFANQQNINTAQLKKTLGENGQPFSMFRESVRDSLAISRFSEYYARSRVIVPDYEIDGEIAANNLNADNSEYELAQILIKNPDVNIDLAQRVKSEIDNGMSFQDAVTQYSESSNKSDGGVIGWRTSAQLPEVYLSAVKDMQVGQVSDVLTTPNGFHILKLLDRKGDRMEIIQTKVSHILIKAESKVAKKQATKKLFQLRQRLANGEDFGELARIYSDDTGSAANGGSLNWVSPGEMVKPFEDAFQKIPLNEVSEPVDTQFGMHILMVEERRKKNVTEQVLRNRVESRLRRERADREFGQWVRELLEGTYVEHVSEPS
jgi:peptidyl-prolyl cis-trans isomerase SurA